MLFRDCPLVDLPAIGALSLMQDEMGDIKFDLRQLKHLMRVEWRRVWENGTAATALLRLAGLGVGRLGKLLPMPSVAEFSAGGFALASLVTRTLFAAFVFVGIIGR